MRRVLGLLAAGCLLSCNSGSTPSAAKAQQQQHSSALSVSPDGSRLFVVHPDADSVSVLEVSTQRILHERSLAAKPPAHDAAGRCEPAVAPRALALTSSADSLFVTGQRSGHVYALDAAPLNVKADVAVCSEP